jgi:hypothetical protein
MINLHAAGIASRVLAFEGLYEGSWVERCWVSCSAGCEEVEVLFFFIIVGDGVGGSGSFCIPSSYFGR